MNIIISTQSYPKETLKRPKSPDIETCSSKGDLWVDNENQNLWITLYNQAAPRDNQAVEQLYLRLNKNNTNFPYSQLTLVYKLKQANLRKVRSSEFYIHLFHPDLVLVNFLL